MAESTPAASSGSASTATGPRTTKESIQDTIISVIIAFALAFVFRGFVVEAFVIPTGSMAPTLMGAHERLRNPETGYMWQVGPWDASPMYGQNYLPLQGVNGRPIKVHDPMSGQTVTAANVPRLSGDRILVLKYLYSLFAPERFDVVVFKYKERLSPEVNYIKRLTGLPGEEIAIVDGDIFYRPHVKGMTASNPKNRWAEAGWRVARKPAHVQEAMWQEVFTSEYAPRNPVTTGRVRTTPWRSAEPGWTIGGRVYEYSGTGATDLVWDSTLLRFSDPAMKLDDPWEIDDRYPYDEVPVEGLKPDGYPVLATRYPVSDVRLGAGIEPGGAGLKATATLIARGHEFQMQATETGVVIRMRSQANGGPAGEWKEVARKEMEILGAGEVTNVQFSHVDQSLSVWIDGKRVCLYQYDWSPAERVERAMGATVEALLAEEESSGMGSIFAQRSRYLKPRVQWSFEGAPVKLHRVSLDRDISYQASLGPANPARGSRPESPMVLNEDQFFVCGDNSPQSLDARFWNPPDEFVRQIDPTSGVVPRKMMLGKAFFVYFPALHREGMVPVPDFGRLRFIW